MGVNIVILAGCEYHFISVHVNLLQHPSNNISICRVNERRYEFGNATAAADPNMEWVCSKVTFFVRDLKG